MTHTARPLAALVLALCAGASARADIVDRLDQPAAEIAATTWWNGAPPKLEGLRGRVVVLHVSDPSRATSKGFLPNLTKLALAHRSDPVTLLEVVETDEDGVAASYVAESGDAIRWQVGWDAAGAMQRGYPGSSLPRTYVIGPDGRVAWHAHVAALTREVIDAQVARCSFYDPKSVPERARPAAKAMIELRFGDAIEAADKVFTDRHAPEDAKNFCARVKKEVARYYRFQSAVVEALVKDLDWAVAYHRVETMLVHYKGTDHAAEVQRRKDELDADPRVKYIVEAQRKLDELVRDVGRLSAKELEKLIAKLDAFVGEYPESAPAKKAVEWRAECERRLAKKTGGK